MKGNTTHNTQTHTWHKHMYQHKKHVLYTQHTQTHTSWTLEHTHVITQQENTKTAFINTAHTRGHSSKKYTHNVTHKYVQPERVQKKITYVHTPSYYYTTVHIHITHKETHTLKLKHNTHTYRAWTQEKTKSMIIYTVPFDCESNYILPFEWA